jgi:hypothetical protein
VPSFVLGDGVLSVAISAGYYNLDAPEDIIQGQYAVP